MATWTCHHVTVSILLALCFISRPCVAFLSVKSRFRKVCAVNVERQSCRHRTTVRAGYHAGRCPVIGKGGDMGMLGSPAELWDSYLGVLDTSPLLTKYGNDSVTPALKRNGHFVVQSQPSRIRLQITQLPTEGWAVSLGTTTVSINISTSSIFKAAGLGTMMTTVGGIVVAGGMLGTLSITAGIIFPSADATAQFFDRKTRSDQAKAESSDDGTAASEWDFARTLRWLFFGFAVQAPWNHYFYVLLDSALPPTPDPLSGTTAVKVFIDQFVQAPVFTIIIFAVLGLLEGKSIPNIREQLDKDYKSTMLANWGIFVPAAVVNLAFCPPQLRVLFLNVVFFAWTIYLSTVVSRGGEEAVTGES